MNVIVAVVVSWPANSSVRTWSRIASSDSGSPWSSRASISIDTIPPRSAAASSPRRRAAISWVTRAVSRRWPSSMRAHGVSGPRSDCTNRSRP
jgi:hypothetical protein